MPIIYDNNNKGMYGIGEQVKETTSYHADRSEAAADASSVSATESAASAAAALVSEGNASSSASAASTSASNALVSENNAAQSEVQALGSENAAALSASNAATSETNALASANNASTSETNALASANAASLSESNAATSEGNASASAAAALASKNAAASSETNAATSESNASTSESNASGSASAASASASAAFTSEQAAALTLSEFQKLYWGALSTANAPSGPDVTIGDLYFDTDIDNLMAYASGGWEIASVSAQDVTDIYTKLDTIETGATQDQTQAEILALIAGAAIEPLSVTATGYVQAGSGSGGVAMTINDGYGNANLTFNHKSGIPEQDGNAGRIHINTDATTGGSMVFQVKSGVTNGVAETLTNVATFKESGIEVDANLTVGSTISEGGTNLSSKYLGLTAKAADSSKLNGLSAFAPGSGSASGYAQIGASNGVMEIGRYIDFHTTNSGIDYDMRFDCSSADNLFLTGGNLNVNTGVIYESGKRVYSDNYDIQSAWSKAASGYIKFRNGLILQWGQTSGGTDDKTINFPIAFTTACRQAVACQLTLATVNANVACVSFTASTLRLYNDGHALGHGTRWWAVGD